MGNIPGDNSKHRHFGKIATSSEVMVEIFMKFCKNSLWLLDYNICLKKGFQNFDNLVLKNWLEKNIFL